MACVPVLNSEQKRLIWGKTTGETPVRKGLVPQDTFYKDTLFYRSSCLQNKFSFTVFFSVVRRTTFLNADPQFFGVQNFWCRDVFSPVRYGAATFCRRKTRDCLFCMKHGLFFSYRFSWRKFFYRRLTCTYFFSVH